eukprot:SAG11_NODE_1500_length_4787_cov_1.409556_4_plen_91_part_00
MKTDCASWWRETVLRCPYARTAPTRITDLSLLPASKHQAHRSTDRQLRNVFSHGWGVVEVGLCVEVCVLGQRLAVDLHYFVAGLSEVELV